jgi:hypothetical protein
VFLKRGLQWRDVLVAAFRVHIDDSGTDPKQDVAIATALIMPAARITALDNEWKKLTEKEGFSDFHMSECVARNPKSEYANWDGAKLRRVISRVRQIGKKFGLKAISLTVNKADYDEVVLPRLEFADKYHYTWAIRNMIGLLDKWARFHNVTGPLEYIYDWMDPKTQREAKAEIDTVMEQSEQDACDAGDAGRYTNYSFRRRQDIPALQCTDAVAWTCYRFALLAHLKTPLSQIAQDCWNDYYEHQSRTWLTAWGMTRQQLADWLERELKTSSREKFRAWEEKKRAAKATTT